MHRKKRIELFVLTHQRVAIDEKRIIWIPFFNARIALCARCFALYSTLFALLTLQFLFKGPGFFPYEGVFLIALSLPAAFDWGIHLLGWPGRLSLRLITGMLLGIGLGRSAYHYIQNPYDEIFWIQLIFLSIIMISFIIVKSFDLNKY